MLVRIANREDPDQPTVNGLNFEHFSHGDHGLDPDQDGQSVCPNLRSKLFISR